jgi:hypothetical protein
VVKERLEKILDFMILNRRSGTTTFLADATRYDEAFVLTANSHPPSQFERRHHLLIPIDGVEWYRGIKPKPILIDNHAMIVILEDAIREIEALEPKAYRKHKEDRRKHPFMPRDVFIKEDLFKDFI